MTDLIFPGNTPEGAARINAAVERRNDLDFDAFMLLRELHQNNLVCKRVLKQAALAMGSEEAEAEELAEDFSSRAERLVRTRPRLDHEVLAALAGRAP
jgi:hypothetical protein